jgi:hypothetical protein
MCRAAKSNAIYSIKSSARTAPWKRKKGRLAWATLLAPAAGPISSPSQQPRARLPNRLVDKSYCRCANGNAASVTLASQTPISPSTMPAFPTLHSSCRRRRNATQWAIQFLRCRLPAPSKSAGSGQKPLFGRIGGGAARPKYPSLADPLCAPRKSSEVGHNRPFGPYEKAADVVEG